MTTPDLSSLVPSKWKTIVGLVGTGLSFLVPLILEVSSDLPDPWPAVIGVVLWLLTALGIYHAPYKPVGTVLAPASVIPANVPTDIDPAADPALPPGGYTKPQNPWKPKR